MQPVRMKTELQTDLEGIRQILIGMAPRLEKQQPGITDQFRQVDMRTPLRLMGRSGETVTVVFEPQGTGDATAIKVEVTPPLKPTGKLRAGFWRWRTRLMLKFALKGAKKHVVRQVQASRPVRDANGVIAPEVLPPEGR